MYVGIGDCSTPMTETATFHIKNSGEIAVTDRNNKCERVGTMEHAQW